ISGKVSRNLTLLGNIAWTEVRNIRAGTTLTMKLNLLNIFDDKTMTVAGYAPMGREARFTVSLKF
ncbi:MAG: hypothetical protein LBC18_07915, partial [Opitutaceae bacterium]|nr:hypothetical protein [Opitutaceae bacterium]